MKRLRLRYLIAGGISLTLGIVFLVLGIVLPQNISKGIKQQTSQYGVMSNQNQEFWIQIPPQIQNTDPTTLYRNFKIFNATNTETLYERRPQFVEQDPSSFYQNISFAHNLKERNNLTSFRSEQEQPGYSFTQHNGIHHIKETKEDQNLVVPNRGALIVWNWLKEAPPYRLAYYGLSQYYNKVIPQYLLLGIVTKYIDILYPDKYSKFEVFAQEELSSFTTAQQHLIWNDTTYGIKIRENLIIWMVGEVNDNLGMEIQRDMMLTFGINNVTQFDTLLRNVVQDIYSAIGTLQSRTDCTPFTGNKICSFNDFSYSQWIRSYLSLEITDQQSLNLNSINSAWVHGQADILDFLHQTFLPIYGQKYKEQFQLFMFQPSSHHYHLIKAYYGDQKPPQNSLWNFKSLDMLIQAGRTYEEQTTIKNTTQYLVLDHFSEIATRLEVSNQQAFVLSLYMEQVIENVWKNKRQLSTNNDIAYLSRWAPTSLADQEIYTYMRVIPRALYGYSLYNIYVSQLGFNCTSLLQYFLKSELTDAQTAAICISDLWGFSKPVSWISWVSLFIEGDKGIAARDLEKLTQIDLSKLASFLSSDNEFGKALESVQQEIYVYYDFCQQPGRFACPDSELIVGQILQSRVTLNFPQFLVSGVKRSASVLTSFQGIELYLPSDFKALEVEAQFDTKADIDVSVARQAFFRASLLRNTTFYEQLFAQNKRDDTHKDIKGFVRELIIQNRFKAGFFIKGVSQKEILEQSGTSSKLDAAILDYQNKPFQDYGIPQLEEPESIISFLIHGNGLESEVLSGSNDIYRSRIFTQYGGSDYIKKTRKFLDLQNRTTYLNESQSLWNQNVYYDFTDGFQINPETDEGDTTVVYFPELRRPVKLQFQREAQLSDLELNVVSVPLSLPDLTEEEEIFGNKVTRNTGVIFNVSNIWNTPTFITKGNFLDYKNREKLPKLRDQNDHIIYGNRITDDIEIWAEQHSGVVLKMSTNFMLSFEMGTDALCFNEEGAFLAPLLTTGRSIVFTDSMIDARFPELANTQEHRKVVQLVFLILGVVFCVLALLLFLRAALIKTHKIRYEDDEEQEIVVSMG